jgi:uncharacterized protein (DUF2164 family)
MSTYEIDESMRICLSAERRAAILLLLKDFHSVEFDEELSPYRAERILDFFVKTLGPSVYNQAIQDARKFMLERLEDLDTELHEAEDLR